MKGETRGGVSDNRQSGLGGNGQGKGTGGQGPRDESRRATKRETCGGVSESGGRGRRKQRNIPMGPGNRSLWSGEPWANHGEPDHGKSGKYPRHHDSREASVGVRVDPEAPGSTA